MNTTDFLVRGLVKKSAVRFMFADTSQTVKTGILTHYTDPVSSHIFGRALTVAALLAPLLEGEEKYTIRWSYQGELKGMVVDVDSQSNIRGIIKNKNLMNQCESERDIFGDEGEISILKSSNGKILNSGVAKAGLMEIVDDVSFFLSTSDQIETEICAILDFNPDPNNPVKAASGFMIQAMPDCDLKYFETLRNRIKSPEFSNLLRLGPMAEEQKTRKLLELVFDTPYDALDKEQKIHYQFSQSPSYTCSCSKQKMLDAVKTLPDYERKEMAEKNEDIKITCEFCEKKYTFLPQEIEKK